jgi:hypothetical protein
MVMIITPISRNAVFPYTCDLQTIPIVLAPRHLSYRRHSLFAMQFFMESFNFGFTVGCLQGSEYFFVCNNSAVSTPRSDMCNSQCGFGARLDT